MIAKLNIRPSHLQEMINYVDLHAPLEACGLVAGKAAWVEKIINIRNQAQSSARFVMDPAEQLKAFQWMESNGFDLLGIFHSHPAGPETASVIDIAEAAYDVVHIVLSQHVGHWKARGFWIENGHATEVILHVVA